MAWRRLLPLPVRWKMALRHVKRAEAAHLSARAAAVLGDSLLENVHVRTELREQVAALAWVPVEHPGMVPLPGEEHLNDDGSDPRGEDWEGYPLHWESIPCILCGEPIPKAGRDRVEGGEGLYCLRCLEAGP